VEQSTWSRVRFPESRGGALHFDHPGLRFTGCWRGTTEPIRSTLLTDGDGTVQWDCLLPNTAATVSLGGDTLEGLGYVERLTLTYPPWNLPFHQIRWGRFSSASRSVIWIDWQGEPSRRWVWLDGMSQQDTILDERGLHGLQSQDGTLSLDLTEERNVRNSRALQALSRRLPLVESLPLGPLRNLRETKRLARGTLRQGRTAVDEGWVIHEEVSW